MTKHRFENHPNNPGTSELLSSSTIHGHVRTLRAFFNWLQRENLTNTNLAAGIKPPKIVKKVISTLSDEEITAILHTFNSNSHAQIRNKVIFMLLLDSGIRIGELVNLQLDDIYINDGLLKVMGKGKKERMARLAIKPKKHCKATYSDIDQNLPILMSTTYFYQLMEPVCRKTVLS
jgi:site-specific recombinase XerD